MFASVEPLLDVRMHDGSRLFATFPEHLGWEVLRDRLQRSPGVLLTSALTDDVTEVWLDFEFKGQRFAINNPMGEYWVFVADPFAPDAPLIEARALVASALNP